MRRTLYASGVFALCIVIGAGATIWLTTTILRLDKEQREYQQAATLEEKARLALWRMDSALGPFIAAESMRPYDFYNAFYPATEVVDITSNQFATEAVLLPSPLLTFASPYIQLHFQLDDEGRFSSPQVPEEAQRDLARSNYLTAGALDESTERLATLQGLLKYDMLLSRLEQDPANLPSATEIATQHAPARGATSISNVSELFSRIDQAQVQQRVPALKVLSNDLDGIAETPSPAPPTPNGQASGFRGGGGTEPGKTHGIALSKWVEEPITPLWVGTELMLVRPVRSNGATVLQGCWLDWAAVETWLVGLCKDLFPDAQLLAVPEGDAVDPELPGRQLASLPMRLLPGPQALDIPAYSSPVRLYLLFAVGGILLATLAIAALLWGTMTLSERRAQFVSAVTHELRTPLTTFQLYTEMLAGGMVRDETKRQEYFETLHGESSRLSHLVENVLAYARLERGSPDDRLTLVPVTELLTKLQPRLEQRAAQSDMHVVVEDESEDCAILVDPDILEQILFNLVDNACKYAAAAENRRIHLIANEERGSVSIRVRDHGPGIDPREESRIFRPFTKPVHDAARSAPGVGLGLGLSRRLARSMGATLRLDKVDEGACFVVSFPRG